MPSHPLKFILASASPRRLELLRQIGIRPDDVIPADVDETPFKDEQAKALSIRLAKVKAESIAKKHPDAVVLASDTVVACGRRILPKAETREQAEACLALLSGRRHQVHTAVTVIDATGKATTRHVMTRVKFSRLSKAALQAYLNSGDWQGKAGGYGIQGEAAAFIPWINGSYSAVVGLPLAETRAMLMMAGIRFYH